MLNARADLVFPRERRSAGDLARLESLVAEQHALRTRLEAEVDRLVLTGVPWPRIAGVLGVTRQAARQAYVRRHKMEERAG
jgi:hypothetical protein